MKKNRWTKGTVYSISDGKKFYYYGALLDSPMVAFFNNRATSPSPTCLAELGEVLYKLDVYLDVISNPGWDPIGKIALTSSQSKEPQRYVRDGHSGELFLYHSSFIDSGYMKPCDEADVKGLEQVAVWDEVHILDRLEAHFEGREPQFPL